jgi:hypothetical protein
MAAMKERLERLEIDNKSIVYEKNNALTQYNKQIVELEILVGQVEELKLLNSELEDENFEVRAKVSRFKFYIV